MILAAMLSSSRLPEQLLLTVDAILYCALAILIAGQAGDNVFGAMVSYLAVCVAVACPRASAVRVS